MSEGRWHIFVWHRKKISKHDLFVVPVGVETHDRGGWTEAGDGGCVELTVLGGINKSEVKSQNN